jgi:hypothetical protein
MILLIEDDEDLSPLTPFSLPLSSQVLHGPVMAGRSEVVSLSSSLLGMDL